MTTSAIQSLLDSLPVYAAILDRDGRVLTVNSLMRDSVTLESGAKLDDSLFWELPWFSSRPEIQTRVETMVQRSLKGSSETLDLPYERLVNGVVSAGFIELSLKPNLTDESSVTAVTATAVDRSHRERLLVSVAESQKVLELEKSKLKMMFDRVAVPITMLEGPEHLCTYQNVTHRELFYGGRDVVGLTVAQASPESVDQGFIRLLDQVYESGESYTGNELPLTLHLKDGTTREFFVNLTFQPTRNSNGLIDGILGSAVDVTPQVLARAKIQETETYFQDLVNVSPAMIWMTDAESRCTFLSRRWYEFTGRTPEEDLGLGWLENIHPDDLPETARVYANAVTNKGPLKVDYRLRDHEGKFHWSIDLGFPRFDSHGEFLGYIGTVTDIHDRIAVQNELALMQTRFERTASATGLGIWYCDLPFDVLTWSEQVKSHFWLPADAHVTIETFYERIHPEDREPTRLAIALSNEKKRHYDIVYRTTNPADESQIKFIRAVGWTDFDLKGHPRRFDGLTLDISADKKFQEELQNAKVAAETANTAKSAFLANMSHEIRTPLGAILGFTELMRDSNLSHQEKENFGETISRNGKALTRIIDDILDLAKVESGKLEIETIDFSFVDLLQESIDLFRERAKEKGLYLRLNLSETVPTNISSDPTRLRQIILNLIGNAVKFTHAGGIKVNVTSEKKTGNQYCIKIAIADTGVGIEREKRERLFQPFTQADTSTTRKYGGTGLGLVVSDRLARALGGDIKIEDPALSSQEHPGSTFIFKFEAAAPDDRFKPEGVLGSLLNEEKSSSLSNDAQPLRGIRILLADDSADNRHLINRLLSKAGANVETASNGREAFESGQKNEFDIVLMDIQMPEMDGYEATRKLRSLNFKTPIVALTAHAMPEDFARSVAAGCDAHLTKPINRAEVIQTILRLTKETL